MQDTAYPFGVAFLADMSNWVDDTSLTSTLF